MTTTDLHAFVSCEVPIGDIIQAPALQVRTAINAGFVSRYAESYRAGAELPPIKLALIEGSLYLLDGWHRLAALRRLGASTAGAEAAPMTWEDALWHAAKANLGNGLPLKRTEFRRVFRAYVKARQYRKGSRQQLKSYREIAKELGFSAHTTIRNWMQQDFPKLAARMAGDSEGNHAAGPPMANLVKQRMQGIQEGLSQAVANFYALNCEETRGEAIRDFEEALAKMKKKPHREVRMDDLTDF